MTDLCAVSSWRHDPVSMRLYPGPGLQCGKLYCWIVWQGTKGEEYKGGVASEVPGGAGAWVDC